MKEQERVNTDMEPDVNGTARGWMSMGRMVDDRDLQAMKEFAIMFPIREVNRTRGHQYQTVTNKLNMESRPNLFPQTVTSLTTPG